MTAASSNEPKISVGVLQKNKNFILILARLTKPLRLAYIKKNFSSDSNQKHSTLTSESYFTTLA